MSAVTPFNPINIGVFQPNQIGGLALWLDAADSSTVITSGANVTAWNDKSGNRYNASAFGTPTYVNNLTNNLSAIRFNGTSSYFSIPGNQLDIATEDFAVFAVVQNTPKPSSPVPIIGKGMGTLTTQQWRLNFDPNNFFQFLILKNSVAAQSYTTYTTPGWTLFGGVAYRATTIQAFTNGNGLITNGTSGVVGSLSDTATNVEIGRGWGGTSFFNSDMGEILLYKGTITATQRQQIESYLAYKWNLQSSLPTTHPYYNSPYNAIASFTNINQITKFGYSVLPNQIGGLALWLDAADGFSVIRTGVNVTAWNDKSGNGRNFTLTGATNPTYSTNIQNGLSVVTFNGTENQTLNNSGFVFPNTAYTIFTVQYLASTIGEGSGYQRFIDGTASAVLFVGTNGGNVAVFTGNGVGNWNDINSLVNPVITNLGVWRIVSFTVYSTVLTTFVNGSANTIKTGTTAGFTGLNIGSALGGGQRWNGYGGEVIVYNNALTTAQRQAVESYLAYKWNLQRSLPVTHPYYNNAFIPNLNQTVPITIIPYIYSPRLLSGLALWLDAADANSVSRTGVNVTAWNDKSGNGYTVTGASGSQPTYTSNTISFNGSQFFTTNYTNFPAAESIFIIVNVSLPSGEGTFLQPNQNGGRQFYLEFSNLQTARSGSAVLLGSTMIYNLRTLVESTNSGTSLNHFINGLNVGSNNSVTPYIGTGSTTTIGARSIGDRGITGSIHEVVIFSSVLSSTQRQQIEGYLAWKWGLQKSLPSNHPFYLFPPG